MKVLKAILKLILVIILIVIAVITTIALFAFLGFLQEMFLIPAGYELWVTNGYYILLLLGIEVLIISYFRVLYIRKTKKSIDENDEIISFVIKFVTKYKKISTLTIIIMLYLVFINVLTLRGDDIIVRSTFNPFGRTYTIQDVEKVKTGFRGKFNIPYAQEKGEFFYKITMKDGKTFNLNGGAGSEGEMYNDDTYLPIEVFDKKLMKYNNSVKKESSTENIEYANIGQVYIDRFVRIIENK